MPTLARAPVVRSGRGAKALATVTTHRLPDTDELAAIQKYALVPIAAEDVAVYTAKVASTQVDRDQERFSLELLQDYAESFPGKALLVGHPWMFGDMDQVPTGKVFAAWVEDDGGEPWLWAKFYFDVTESTRALIGKLNTGIVSYVSIGYYAPQRTEHYDSGTGQFQYAELTRGSNGEKGEAIELSLVFLGSQRDAYVVKSALKMLPVQLEQSRERLLAAIEEGRQVDSKGFMAAMGQLVDKWFGKVGDAPPADPPPDTPPAPKPPPDDAREEQQEQQAVGAVKQQLIALFSQAITLLEKLPSDQPSDQPPPQGQSAGAGADAKAETPADAKAETSDAKAPEDVKPEDVPKPPAADEKPPAEPEKKPPPAKGAKGGTVEDKEFREQLAAFGGKVEGGFTKILARLDGIDKRLEGVEKVVDETEQASGKMLDRIEGIEGAMSGARGGPDDEEAEVATNGQPKKSVKSVFENFVPTEFSGRRGR